MVVDGIDVVDAMSGVQTGQAPRLFRPPQKRSPCLSRGSSPLRNCRSSATDGRPSGSAAREAKKSGLEPRHSRLLRDRRSELSLRLACNQVWCLSHVSPRVTRPAPAAGPSPWRIAPRAWSRSIVIGLCPQAFGGRWIASKASHAGRLIAGPPIPLVSAGKGGGPAAELRVSAGLDRHPCSFVAFSWFAPPFWTSCWLAMFA